MKILVIGAGGQLGTELCHLLNENDVNYTGTTSSKLDITDRENLIEFFKINKPEIVYDCAAYTNVDGAEEEPGKTINYRVNVEGTKNIADSSEMVGATLVYISTDYVFDGNKNGMYTENDIPNPQNEYGRAKLLGEQAVSETMSKYYIIRTSWVFGKYGSNFFKTMLNLAKIHDRINVVNDQFGRPTWTRTLAEFMLFSVNNNVSYGLYQLSNDDDCSWYEFAKEILKDKNIFVDSITSEQYVQRAYRPRHSVMDINKAKSVGFAVIPWKKAVNELFKTIDI